ncbi:MAG: hypothetical protein HY722_11345 [Planctomycetes bacterium]|nr:hypothetical protein [Planctomycetota bacterium]
MRSTATWVPVYSNRSLKRPHGTTLRAQRGDLLKEWAYLDTFDMLAPRHDFPQTRATLGRWLQEAGLEAVDVHYGHNGLEARARRS